MLILSIIVAPHATNVLLDGLGVDSRRSPLALIGTAGTLLVYENLP
ncbi:hypothetical protein [Corynebacterium pseudodiphtheriticum]|nr:hypothetical protein [Corynebacterium pseudodiphtheriticum]UQV55655.1 hypothetical protein L9H27_07690 [Corynebacterium pseudodiphtheriticum]